MGQAQLKFEILQRANPQHANTHYYLGLIYEHQGKKEQAKQRYQQALTLNKDHPQAKKALKKIGR